VAIPAAAASATVYTKLGASRAVGATQGAYTFNLDAATGNTNGSDPKDYVMGGSPVILVQSDSALSAMDKCGNCGKHNT
jgi:hypothetical protein